MSIFTSVNDRCKAIIDEVEEKSTEDELFVDSLDCIASSSRSCSASNSDSDPESNLEKMIKFPLSVSKFVEEYGVWISEPAPVVERRGRLLHEMGLLNCSKPLSNRRALSCDEFSVRGDNHDSTSLTSPLNTIDMVSHRENNGNLVLHSSSHSSTFALSRVNGTETKYLAASPRKPPSGKTKKRTENPYKGNGNANSNPVDCSSSGELLFESDEESSFDMCRIKDLDNGKEFVVNKVNKLREVGTGKQLTMEEFEISLGHSPIVQELMRRHHVQNATDPSQGNDTVSGRHTSKRKVGRWFSALRSKEKSSDEKDTGSDKAGRRSSSATDDSQEVSFHGLERVRVKQYGKQFKELTRLYKTNEIQAHDGSIWSVKFSLDGKYLASAGEDGVIHIWQVVEVERKEEQLPEKHDDLFSANGSPELSSVNKKSTSVNQFHVPETMFSLSDKPVCSFFGHYHDVLDLSWSKSHQILSSSMDKTVRLWDLSSKTCLKIFSHSDYVTCIHFNPVDDRYFISGSLDSKIRIWSIRERQVVDWTDLHEMVTSASYTPDGQAAYFGTYEGNCWVYNTSDNKLNVKRHINLENRRKKKKKAHSRKITGFQFAPGSSSEVLISSADSRVRVVDGVDLVHKFKGFRNPNSQIYASVAANRKYVVAASEDSSVYVWKNEVDRRIGRTKTVSVTNSYEYFQCHDVSVAIPWPGFTDASSLEEETELAVNNTPTPVDNLNGSGGQLPERINGTICNATDGYFMDRVSATWPEEKLGFSCRDRSSRSDALEMGKSMVSAHGMVIVTAGLRGYIRTFQNFGVPI